MKTSVSLVIYKVTFTHGFGCLQSCFFHPYRHTCNDIFVVIYKQWTPNFLYPYGHVICRLDTEKMSRADDVAILRLQNNLPHPFGIDVTEKKANAEANKIAAKVSKEDFEKRVDFRKVPTITIDNDDTTDMDDALSFQVHCNFHSKFLRSVMQSNRHKCTVYC